MAASGPPPTRRISRLVPAWLGLLVGGAVLFVIVERALVATGNINLAPSVILLGAFTVPIAFTAYVYQRVNDFDVGVATLAMCALWGGILGVVLASLVEAKTIQHLGVASALGVGLIEEAAKLVVPLAIFFFGRRYAHEADGLVIGVAVGMGFAAFETMGYGLTALLKTQGDVGQVEQLFLLRGLLAPAGHAAWTGLACAALWRCRESPGAPAVRNAVFMFGLVVVLHGLWDGLGLLATYFVLAAISLGVLRVRVEVAAAERRRGIDTGGAAQLRLPEPT